MFNSVVVEVVIGLVFVFSLLAVLVTYTNSIITTALNLRAEHLKNGIIALITDEDLQARLLTHPLVNIIDMDPNQITSQSATDAVLEGPQTDVSYIPPETFVEALIGILLEQADRVLYKTLEAAINTMETSMEKLQLRGLFDDLRHAFSEETLRSIYGVVQNVSDDATRARLHAGLQEVEAVVSALRFQDGGLVPLLRAIEDIGDEKLKGALRTLVSSAENLEDAERKLTNWFNDGMGRATEAFKKVLQRYSLVVALTLTVFFNVDTIYLSRALWQNDALRAEVAAAATAYETGVVQGAIQATDPEAIGPDASTEALLESLDQQVSEAQATTQTLLDLQLPIGWQFTEVTDEMVRVSQVQGLSDPYNNGRNLWNFVPGNSDQWFWLWIQKLAGIAVTTIAAAQGAPFWFDLLRRLTTRRSS